MTTWTRRTASWTPRASRIRGFEKILMIYSAERSGIDVLRVVHGARDLNTLDLDGQ